MKITIELNKKQLKKSLFELLDWSWRIALIAPFLYLFNHL